jgi:hypothetical protein
METKTQNDIIIQRVFDLTVLRAHQVKWTQE